MKWKELINAVNGERVQGTGEEPQILGLSSDSRQVQKGDLFFCISGETFDGTAFARQALRQGAAAIVCEREQDFEFPVWQIIVPSARAAMSIASHHFYGRVSEKMKVIGITGTNGKTTTAHMLAWLFERAGKKTGIIGTLGAKYGAERVDTGLTTPDPIALQKILADMYASGVEYVFMEVSAHALWYEKTCGMAFEACIFTNLTQDHLDFFPDMQAYKNAKKKLFQTPCKIAVLNGDDEAGRELATCANAEKIWSYTVNAPSQAAAGGVEEDLTGVQFTLHLNGETACVSLRMAGLHNVYNALGAAACAVALGLDVACVAEGLSEFRGVNGRLEHVSSFHGGEVFVDFAHTPDGLQKSLSALKKHCKGRLFCLFGCGGNRDKSKRPMMGERVAELADFAVLTSDNPRFEDPLDILSQIEKGYRLRSTKYVVVPDREKAIAYALDCMRGGDVLLVAGKGGEKYQEIMGIKYPFDDNAIIKKLMEEKGNLG